MRACKFCGMSDVTFHEVMYELCMKNGLYTNTDIAKFLGSTSTEWVRMLLAGKHKPHKWMCWHFVGGIIGFPMSLGVVIFGEFLKDSLT